MRSGYNVKRQTKILFYILCLLILVGYIYVQFSYPSEREKLSTKEFLVYEGVLTWEKTDGTKEQITVPGTYEVEPGQTMVLTMIIPEDFKSNAIAIRGSQQRVKFYIDGKLRSEYDTKKSRVFGSDSVSRYVFCETSVMDAGKELRIELMSHSKLYSGVVNPLFFGDKMDIWSYIFSCYGAEFFIALFLLFVGIIVILFSIALNIVYKFTVNLEYLGWCMIFGAIWMLGSSKFRQLYVSNVSGLASICFIIVMLCPIPILFYVDSVQKGKYHKLFAIMEGIALLNCFLLTALQVANIADYLDTYASAILIMAVTILTVFVTFCIDWCNGRIKEYLLIVIGLIFAMLMAFAEAISVYFVVYASGIFLEIGLLVLLFCTVLNTMKDIRAVENEKHLKQSELRRKQAENIVLQMIRTLITTIEAKEEYAKGHSYRVAEYSALIAREMGWNEIEIENLRKAAHFHDIGKIGIPDTILNKPGKLTDAEYQIIKRHTTIGADILKNITIIEHVEEATRYHHERYDGKGYPLGLRGNDIPLYSRIIAVADSFDAMNVKKIYRDALSKEEIRKEITDNKGLQFDPDVADAFLKLFDENRLDINIEAAQMLDGKDFSEGEIDQTLEARQFIFDIMDTFKNQNKLESTDYITGLPTRNAGQMAIAQKIQENEGWLVFLDLDNLKKVNDIYGHRAGDMALKMLGEAISRYSDEDAAYRAGGDEFVMYVSDSSKENIVKRMEQLYKEFYYEKNKNIETKDAGLSAGLCLCKKGESFDDCYLKADKALYYIKQNGKDNFSFYHEIDENNVCQTSIKDLEQVAKVLRDAGNYKGAFDIDNREFAKIYEYMSNLGERYKHTCHLVMITVNAVSDDKIYIDKIEKAMECMEMAILNTIRNVDICTRYSSMQYLLILVESGEENIPHIMERIFNQYHKQYGGMEFKTDYGFIPIVME